MCEQRLQQALLQGFGQGAGDGHHQVNVAARLEAAFYSRAEQVKSAELAAQKLLQNGLDGCDLGADFWLQMMHGRIP